MKSKKNISLVLLLAILIYGFSFIATKKNLDPDPCQIALDGWYQKDSVLRIHSYYYGPYGEDTLVIYSDSVNTINWNTTTDTICNIYKNSCNYTGKPILVVNKQDTVRSNWNTRFGKKIYFKKCP